MIFCITSNNLSSKNIMTYSDNFVFSVIHSENIAPSMSGSKKHVFDIFYQDGMGIEEEESTGDMKFIYHPVNSVEQALTKIFDYLSYYLENEAEKAEDLRDEIITICSCDYDINSQVCKYLNNLFSDNETDYKVSNIYKSFKIPSTERLVEILKKSLNTEFIYSDDSVAFGYAIYKALDGAFL